MECCERTEADKKGGHLALRAADSQLVLRESAQCSKEDEKKFQDIAVHKFFNTNNLWLRLDLLKSLMDSVGGFVPLPTIFNSKTADPQLDYSTPVFQLEVRCIQSLVTNCANDHALLFNVDCHGSSC
jgi:UDP-N-acetylglucosamine pyrophosphorylase